MHSNVLIRTLLIGYTQFGLECWRKGGEFTVSCTSSSFCLHIKWWNGLSCFSFELGASTNARRFTFDGLQLSALGRVLNGRCFEPCCNCELHLLTLSLLPVDLPSSHTLTDEIHNDKFDGGGDTALGTALHAVIFGGLVAALEHYTLLLRGNVGPELAVLIIVTRFAYLYSYIVIGIMLRYTYCSLWLMSLP